MSGLLSLGTGNSMGLLYYREKDHYKRPTIIWTNLLLLVVNGLIWYAIIFFLAPTLSDLMFHTERYTNLIRLYFLGTVFATITDPWLAYLRMEVLEPFVVNQKSNISEYNIHAIKKILSAIGMNHSKFVRSSDFVFETTSNELLCYLTNRVGGKTYLCGGGADGYNDEKVFDRHRVQLEYQKFSLPNYKQFQRDSFTPGLSIIDAAINLGWKKIFSHEVLDA